MRYNPATTRKDPANEKLYHAAWRDINRERLREYKRAYMRDYRLGVRRRPSRREGPAADYGAGE